MRRTKTSGRGWGAALAALAAGTLAVGVISPAAHAAGGLSVGEPVLDLAFEGDVADASAFAHETSLRGRGGADPSASYVEGVIDGTQALALGGSTYLDLGSSTELLPSSLSLSFWIRPDERMSGEEVITWNKNEYNGDGFYVSSVSDSNPLLLSVGTGDGKPREYRVSSDDRAAFFPAGEWTHIVVSFDARTKAAAFWRNGVAVGGTALGTDAPGVIDPEADVTKTIGYNGPVYDGSYLKSALDQYRLYRGVTTVDDVAALYEQGGGSLDREALAAADLDDVSLPATASVALSLQAVGSRGSEISWRSSHPDVIAADGTITAPEGDDVTVTLTATARYAGGPAQTRDFEVTVPSAKEPLMESGIDVLLSDDYLSNAAAKEHEYLLSLSSEKFLYWFYRTAGLTPPTDKGYGGWEDGSVTWNFRGHAFGHYMSALSMSYASARDAEVKEGLLARITDAVDGLEEVQASYDGTQREGYIGPFRDTALDAVEGRGESDDPVIVPYYNLHKVLAGLLHIHQYLPDSELGDRALAIAEGFGEYLYGRVSTLADTKTLLNTEYGGMNDALYELYLQSGGNAHIKVAAEAFDEVTLFQQLADGKDVLDNKHANTTIPKFIGALKRYTVFTQNPDLYETLTAEEKDDLGMYRAAAENFFRIVVDHHTYATGANSQSEHFHGPDELYFDATQRGEVGNAQTAETCNEYNMLKLARELFRLSHDVTYADYYENTFINTIVSSQNPDTGMTTYFQAMAPGYAKVYGAPFTEFWCCIGTGMESMSKLSDSIYFRDGSTTWVNLFFSSTFTHPDTHLTLTQEANLPADDTVRFTVSATGGEIAADAAVRLRVPGWIAGDPAVSVNGEKIEPIIRAGYVVLDGLADGDVIDYTMPMEVALRSTQDNEDFAAIAYGPVLLSAGLGTDDLDKTGTVGVGVRIATLDDDATQRVTVATDTVEQWKADVATNVERIEDSADGQVRFRLNNTLDGEGLVFTPHYRRHDERYGLYLTYEVADSEAAQAEILRDKEALREQAQTIDQLTTFDNNNAEASKNLAHGGDSSVGSFGGRTYRHANSGGWFSYDLEVDPDAEANFLRSTYYSGDKGRSFEVYLNDELLKTETLTDEAGSGVFYDVTDEIPDEHVTGDGVRQKVDPNGTPVLDENGDPIPVVTVRYQSTGGFAGGLFGVATTRPAEYDTTAKLSALSFDAGQLSPAFDADTDAYTLTVPEGTQQVSFEASPWVPSGLVRVGDILIDDTQPRVVRLAQGEETTLTLNVFAQDHETSRPYTIVIREGGEAAVEASATVQTRCVAGKAVLVVRVSNAGDAAVSATIDTAYGAKTLSSIDAGAARSAAFSTRSAEVEAGAASVAVENADGDAVELSAEYAATDCG